MQLRHFYDLSYSKIPILTLPLEVLGNWLVHLLLSILGLVVHDWDGKSFHLFFVGDKMIGLVNGEPDYIIATSLQVLRCSCQI